MKINLTSGEINSFADDIYEVLEDIPLFYLIEILELAHEKRMRDGDNPNLDITSDEEDN